RTWTMYRLFVPGAIPMHFRVRKRRLGRERVGFAGTRGGLRRPGNGPVAKGESIALEHGASTLMLGTSRGIRTWTHPNWKHVHQCIRNHPFFSLRQRLLDPSRVQFLQRTNLGDLGLLVETPEDNQQLRWQGMGQTSRFQWVRLNRRRLHRRNIDLL